MDETSTLNDVKYLLTQLSTQIEQLNAKVMQLETALSLESQTREGEGSTLSNNVDSLQNLVNLNSGAITNEMVDRSNADIALDGRISDLTDTVSSDKAYLVGEIERHHAELTNRDLELTLQASAEQAARIQGDQANHASIVQLGNVVEGHYVELDYRVGRYDEILDVTTMDTLDLRMDADDYTVDWSMLSASQEWRLEIDHYINTARKEIDRKLAEAEQVILEANTIAAQALANTDTSNLVNSLQGAIGMETLDNILWDKVNSIDGLTNDISAKTTALRSEMLAKIAEAKATADQAAADILTEAMARVDAMAIEAQVRADQITLKAAELQDGITQETQNRIDGDAVVVGQLNAYKTSNDAALAAVIDDLEVTTSAQSATASQLNALTTTVTNNDASVRALVATETTARSNADTALGGRIDTLTTTVSNNDTTVRGLINSTQNSVTTLEGNTNSAITSLTSDVSNINLRGQDLVSNGLGQLMSNKYWTATTFTAMDKPAGAGSFVSPLGSSMITGDEFIAVDPSRTYKFAYYLRQTVAGIATRAYGMFVPHDVDKKVITPTYYMAQPNTLTKLAVALKPGDTTMTLESTANWYNLSNTNTHLRSAIFWNYVDGTGYKWPVNTYSRNSYLDLYNGGAINGNVITLKTAWTGPEIPAGTDVSNASAGGTYMYLGAVNAVVPEVWTQYSGEVSGIHPSGTNTNATSKFPMMTAYVKLGFLVNRTDAGGTNASSRMAFGGVSLRDWSVAKDPALASATALSDLTTRVTTAEGTITSQGTSITSLNNSLRTTNSNVTKALDAVTVKDTRSTNELPNWYWTNHKQRIVNEFKQASAIGVTGLDYYVNLETRVYWTDSSGGPVIQTAYAASNPLLQMTRRSTGSGASATWTAWEQPLKTLSDTINTKANSSALTSLDSKVTEIDGRVTSNASNITTLQGNITTINGALTTKADATALASTNTNVTNLDGRVTANTNAITGLTSTVNSNNAAISDIQTTLATMDSASAEDIEIMKSYLEVPETTDNGLLTTDSTLVEATRYNYYSTQVYDREATTRSLQQLEASVDTSLASMTQYVEVTVNDRITSEVTAINATTTQLNGQVTTISETVSSIDGIQGVKTVTIDNNGVLSGYGLLSELKDGVVTSGFGINADQFYVGAPASGKKPFLVLTSQQTINGKVYPAGTWIDAAYIANATIGSAQIANLAVDSLKLADAAVGTAKIADLAVTGAKIANASIGSAQIEDAAITSAKIANAAIGSAQIGDLSVNTLKIADNAVTLPTYIQDNSSRVSAANLPANVWNSICSVTLPDILAGQRVLLLFSALPFSATATETYVGYSAGDTTWARLGLLINGNLMVTLQHVNSDSYTWTIYGDPENGGGTGTSYTIPRVGVPVAATSYFFVSPTDSPTITLAGKHTGANSGQIEKRAAVGFTAIVVKK